MVGFFVVVDFLTPKRMRFFHQGLCNGHHLPRIFCEKLQMLNFTLVVEILICGPLVIFLLISDVLQKFHSFLIGFDFLNKSILFGCTKKSDFL